MWRGNILKRTSTVCGGLRWHAEDSDAEGASSKMKLMIWRIWIVTMVLIIISPNIIGVAEARKCYVCGTGSDAVFRLNGYTVTDEGDLFFLRSQNPSAAAAAATTTTYARPPSCLGFEGIDSSDEFIRECPDGYQGCLTQIDGTEVIRTCDPLALNDCKVANKVTYCYCNGDLCNSRPVSSFGIDDQSNYDASESGDDDDADDYGDEFSGMRPTTTVSLPGGIKTDSRGNSGRGRSTPGGGWTTGQQGMNANSHTPFHYAATLGPPTATKPWSSSSSSSSGSCRFCMSDTKGLVRPLAQLLIVLVLSLGRNR